jgi:hypothetical protein
MIRQILEVFFLAQVVTEAIVENSEKAMKDASKQVEQVLKTAKQDSVKGNHRVEAAVEATMRDYEQVVVSVKELLSNVWVLVQEYAKLPVPHVLSSIPKVSEKVTSKAAR